MILQKSNLRKNFIKIRNNISFTKRIIAQKKAMSILKLNFFKILSFSSKPKEINLLSLNKKLAKENRLLLPKTSFNNLLIYEVTDPKTQLIKGNFNILEPDEKKCKLVNPKDISCVLVPGLAFDKNNQRLGYGKGYYDRFLTKIKCPIIGIGFMEQLSNYPLPIESHDIKLNHLSLF